MPLSKRPGLVALCLLLWALPPFVAPLGAQSVQADPVVLALELFTIDPRARARAVAALAARGKPDAVPALIQALRFFRGDPDIVAALRTLTGADPGDWFDWMLWQQAHPEVAAFEGFDRFKAAVMASLDPSFQLFLFPGVRHEIRLEEITWGGVAKDGIPALIDPPLLTPSEAGYLTDDELVFGVQINGDARAYPLRILDWHEMFNDVIGGVPVALAYCTLCGSGILFETLVEGRSEPFVFGSSGLLYRSNKLMYDQETHSLWNQFTGRPVVGALTGSGIELRVRPVAITAWAKWLARHPDTTVLSLDTGYARDYRPGEPYGDYFASPDLMFPALVPRDELKPKDYVFALRLGRDAKGYPLEAFQGGRVINDKVGDVDVVLIGEAESRSVRAYDAEGRVFAAAGEGRLTAGGEAWRIEEEALVAESGQRLARLPGHIAYWFAWVGYNGAAPLYPN
jgi:hypothetical protein